jgi:GGDEF domain-containing protein
MMKPTIHLNGTGREQFEAENLKAYEAVNDALTGYPRWRSLELESRRKAAQARTNFHHVAEVPHA